MTKKDPIIVIQVVDDIVVLTGTADEHVIQSTNKDYVKQAKQNMTKTKTVPLVLGRHQEYPTGSDTLLEIVASIVAIAPYNSVIQRAPIEILKELEVR